jgi:hypothetical protein
MAGAFSPFGPLVSMQTPEEERLAQLKRDSKGALGGFADFGGATSFIANETGNPVVAEEIERLKAESPDASWWGDMANPFSYITGPASDIFQGIKDYATSPASEPPKAATKDDFIKSRTQPIPSKGEYEAQALDRVRNSPAYQQLSTSRKKGDAWRAEQMLTKEAERARKNYAEDVARIEKANQELPNNYTGYTQGINDQLESYYGQDFADRNPSLAKGFASAGPVIAAMLTRGAFKGVNNRLGKFIDEAKDAASKGNLNDEAAALDKLQWWRNKGKYSKLSNEVKAKATGFATGAAVPLEMQLFSDYQDRKLSPDYQDANGNWQRARAQQKAEEKLSNWPKYLAENGPLAAFSGILGAATGSKFGGKSNVDEATALLDPPSPDRLNTMAQQKIAAIKAQQAVQAAQNGAGPASHPALEQANLQAAFKKGLDRLEKGKPFAPKGNFMRGAPQEAKDRVRTGGDTFDLNAANVDPNNIARARKAQANNNLLLGLGATGATGYSALLAQRLAEMEENKPQNQ